MVLRTSTPKNCVRVGRPPWSSPTGGWVARMASQIATASRAWSYGTHARYSPWRLGAPMACEGMRTAHSATARARSKRASVSWPPPAGQDPAWRYTADAGAAPSLPGACRTCASQRVTSRFGWPCVRAGSGRDNAAVCLTVSGSACRAGQVREHRADRRFYRGQLAPEAGVEAVPDLAGGRAVLCQGRVGDLAYQVVQVGGGDGPQLQCPRDADRRQGDDACRRRPAPYPGPAGGRRERHDPGQGGNAGQFQRVRAGRRIPGQGAGQPAQLIRRSSPRVQPDLRPRAEVRQGGAEEQRQCTEYSGQRMGESRADRDTDGPGREHQQQPACQYRDARRADGAPELYHHRCRGHEQQAGGHGPGQAGQMGEGAGTGRGREAGVQVRHCVAPGPPGGQLRGDQDGHGEEELPEPDPPAGDPPQRFCRAEGAPDHGTAGHQAGQDQQAPGQQGRFHPGQHQRGSQLGVHY